MRKFSFVFLFLIFSVSAEHPTDINEYIQAGNCEGIESAFKQADSLLKLYAQGFCFHKKQDYEKAKHFYSAVIEKDSSYRRVLYNLADVYFNVNEHDLALKYAKLDVIANPDDTESLILLALSYGYSGNKGQSIKYFSQVLETNPKDLSALYELAMLHFRNGEKQEACALLKQAIALEHSFANLKEYRDGCEI